MLRPILLAGPVLPQWEALLICPPEPIGSVWLSLLLWWVQLDAPYLHLQCAPPGEARVGDTDSGKYGPGAGATFPSLNA